jgi:predicted type IV restriction endonuclease
VEPSVEHVTEIIEDHAMRIRSPLSNLSDVLSQVKEAASRYRDTLRKNEAATRAVLIDPVLRALGWDTANTYMVEVEKTLDKSRVDYALYDSNAIVKIIIEAKSLSTNLQQADFIMSLVNYAFTFKLQDIFLTDGIIWQHFTSFQPGNVSAARTLDIANDDPVECAAYLVQRLDAAKFWPEEQSIDRLAQQIAQLESTVATLQQEVARLSVGTTSSTQAISQSQPPTLAAATSKNGTHDVAVQYIALEDLPDVTGTKPTLFRLPDGTVHQVGKWKDVLRESCKFALASNPRSIFSINRGSHQETVQDAPRFNSLARSSMI